jgi:hypothetical protein
VAEWTKCVECGKSVSAAADVCPHCGKNCCAVQCIMCDLNGKQSEMIKDKGIHRTCWDRYIAPHLNQFSCVTCGTIFNYKKHPSMCSKCGEPFHSENDRCLFCGEVVVRGSSNYHAYDQGSISHLSCEQAHQSLHEQETAKNQKNGCFIASTVYENPNALEVNTFRYFRDEVLSLYSVGRKFIFYYYKISPFIALLISKSSLLKMLAKVMVLEPIIWIIARRRRKQGDVSA